MDFVIGADGAHSRVRSLAGIAMRGPDDLAEYQSVHFRAELAPVVADQRYGLNVITHPDAAGVLTPKGPGDRWAYAREWRPGQERLDECSAGSFDRADHDRRRRTRDPDGDRRGQHLLLCGAAGRAVPKWAGVPGRGCGAPDDSRGGTGMNTAIHDAYDLGWKLAWTLRGWAPSALLDSYEAMRRPIGEHNVARSGPERRPADGYRSSPVLTSMAESPTTGSRGRASWSPPWT